MAAPSPREQALSLLASANNNGDLAVKLSSLKQVKDILLAAEPHQAAELFPYLVELQSSHEPLVRKTLIEVIEDIGLKALNHFSIFVPVLLTFLHDGSPSVVKQSIVTGTSIFSTVLEELALQFHRRGHVDMWLEELWTQTSKFKDAVIDILFEAAPLAVKLLTIKFIETNILLFTSERNDSEISPAEAISRERTFSISWLAGHHPVLNKAALSLDAHRFLGIMLDLLQSARNLPGLLTISIVNSLATIARRRPALYSHILSALLKFDPNFEMAKGCHVASTQYSIRTAFLGFLRCTHPTILESRERLMKALRAMSAGDAADQVIRQVEKMIRMSERAARDARLSKDEQMSDYSLDQGRKRSQPSDSEDPNNNTDIAPKRVRYGPNTPITPSADIDDTRGQEYANGVSAKGSLLDNNMTPVEQMIAMIGALIAEGERGVESLEILVSNMHPDLLADIVITNMRHLPKNSPSFARATSSIQSNTSDLMHNVASTVSSSPEIAAQSGLLFDMPSSNSLPSDPKRDQRRDPRRLDPRRSMAATGVPTVSVTEDAAQAGSMEYHVDSPSSFVNAPSPPGIPASESLCIPFIPKPEANLTSVESLPASQSTIQEEAERDSLEEAKGSVEVTDNSLGEVERDAGAQISYQFVPMDDVYSSSSLEIDKDSPDISDAESPESPCLELPVVPSYIDLTEEQQRALDTSAIKRIFDSYKNLRDPVSKEMRMALLARMVAMVETDNEAIVEMQRHLAFHFHHQKGQELVMHVLFHLYYLSEGSSSLFATKYENFLLGVVKSVLDNIPSTDKSVGQLLREVPYLTDSVMGLLDDLCCDIYMGTDGAEVDRVTQGLYVLLNLIVWRPLNRQACLDIALKCAVHPKDNVRVKAINLVAKKLYAVGYISENIEQFAMRKFLSVVDQHPSDVDSQSEMFEQRTEREIGSQEASVSGSHISEMGLSEKISVGLSHAQQHLSLFFALFPQKPSLLRVVFENYERSPKATKQAVHRQIPALLRAFGPRYSDLLQVISDPPPGSENLLTQVLHILSEGTPPPPDLVAFVKHLYETKLKDASILIPIISSFSRNEVLPIFPQLVNLPSDKFQTALAHILQGSAHTGPALTPAEVMVAIHDIHPDRDHLPLKKITDACSVCFEQRTVFTQQVMSKALDQMVDQTPLPLLFMRTVIQTTDAFPALVDFVMELLSKLVRRQVWRMPKLWVGFLKCVSQTQPHSFRVLLQLPSPQLESALNKYPHLRGPLAAYASQPSIGNSLSRATLVSLGLANEGPLHASDANSSLKGTMPT